MWVISSDPTHGPKFKLLLPRRFATRPTKYTCQVSSTSAQRSRSHGILKMLSPHGRTDRRTDERTDRHLTGFTSHLGRDGAYDMMVNMKCYRVNPLTGTLKSQSNGPLYSNTVIGTLAVDGWAVTFNTARRGLQGGLRLRPVPSSLYLS